MKKKFSLLLFLLFSFEGFSQDTPEYTLVLIGDAGEHKPFRDAVMKRATEELVAAGEKSTVIFLGDNIYPVGLPPESSELRAEMESKLVPQLDVIKLTPGLGFVIPGNHDWAKGKPNGIINIKEQEEFIVKYLDNEDVFQPKSGCPGPVTRELSEDILLIMIDTQWLLSEEKGPQPNKQCENKNQQDVYEEVEEIVMANMDKKIVFAAHHPVYTFGSHGGVYQFKQHIFPLTDFSKNLYIPLPVIGSIYPLYRTWFGNIQDATNKRYQRIMQELTTRLESHPYVIHAAGHEHAMQHSTVNDIEFIVSGAGSKTEHVKKKKPASFVNGDTGYATVSFYPDKVWLEFWSFNKANPKGYLSYQTELFQK